MGTKYPSQSISGYNASPPPDDGTAVAANEISWAKHKTKLGDPIRTLAEAIDTAILTHVDESVIDKAVAFTTTVAEHKRTINITALATQSLGDAATMGTGYVVFIHNSHSAANTVDRATGGNTIDGVAANVTLQTKQGAMFVVNAAANGYYMIGNIANNSVDTAQLVADAVDSTKIADNSIGIEHMQDNSVSAAELANAAISGKADIAAAILATDELLISDGGTLRRTDVSRITTFLNPVIAPEGGGLNLQAEVVTTSGGTKEVTGIPSWVTRIVIAFDGVSQVNAVADLNLQLGDATSFETTGYNSSAQRLTTSANAGASSTNGFVFTENTTQGDTLSGLFILQLQQGSSNTWSAKSMFSSTGNVIHIHAGRKSLTGTLTRFRILVGAGGFDAGAFAVSWS